MFFSIYSLIVGLSLGVIIGSSSSIKVNVKIVNGTSVSTNAYPYIVNLRYNDSSECTGVLVNREWVLSAGHCTDDLLTVHYGSLHLDEGVSANTVKVIKNITHPDYKLIQKDNASYLTLINDVGLFKLEYPLNFSKSVNQGKFPKIGATFKEDNSTIGTNIGWGYIDGNDTNPDFLQKVDLTVYDPNYCAARYNNSALFDPKTMFCSGDNADSKGQCNGDSGSPFVIGDEIWGIASYTNFPCIKAPGVYMKIEPYLAWIKNVTGLSEF